MRQKNKSIRAIAAAVLAAAIFFYVPAGHTATNTTLRVMSYNIHHAEGIDGQIDTQRIADLILAQNIDLVGLQEVDRRTTRVSGRDLIAELAQQTGMSFVFSNNLSFQGGQYGNAILSRFPIRAREHRLLPKVGSNEQRGWLKAVVDVNGKDLSFWTTHLASVSDDTERLICVTNFNNWLTNETVPVIFCGDFNASPGSSPYNLLAQKWDDAWTKTEVTPGYTSPVPFANKRIDFVWIQRGHSLRCISSSVPFTTASDHFPVVTELVLTNFPGKKDFYFPLNEGSGSNISDTINGLSGTFGNTAPSWSNDAPTGQSGDFSLKFNGTNKVSVPDPNQFIGTNSSNGDYTLQAWVKLPLNFVPLARMILFQFERVPGFSFSINTNRTLHTTTFNISNILSTATLPNDAQWHHVAVVHTDGANMRFFIDATLAATVPYTNGVGSRTSSLITVGSSASGANPFTGFLDRVSFSSQTLVPAQLDFPAVPWLGIRKVDESLIVFWPIATPEYTLQMTPNLEMPVWTNFFSQVQENENRAVLVPTNAARFFRLVR